MHDIGNLVNREDHSQSGSVMAFRLFDIRGMSPEDICTVTTAIGNHDEGTGVPVDEVSAALILADKSDVRRSRVRNNDPATFDIHDRVNYSVTSSKLTINEDKKEIELSLTLDQQYSSIMEYFEIFLERMLLCRKASDRLGYRIDEDPSYVSTVVVKEAEVFKIRVDRLIEGPHVGIRIQPDSIPQARHENQYDAGKYVIRKPVLGYSSYVIYVE